MNINSTNNHLLFRLNSNFGFQQFAIFLYDIGKKVVEYMRRFRFPHNPETGVTKKHEKSKCVEPNNQIHKIAHKIAAASQKQTEEINITAIPK